MIRALGVIVLVLALTATAGASLRPPVPLAAQAQIARKAPSLAYVPTRMALGFHYSGWLKTPDDRRDDVRQQGRLGDPVRGAAG